MKLIGINRKIKIDKKNALKPSKNVFDVKNIDMIFSYLKCATEKRIDVAFIFITGQNIKWCFIHEFINGMRI